MTAIESADACVRFESGRHDQLVPGHVQASAAICAETVAHISGSPGIRND